MAGGHRISGTLWGTPWGTLWTVQPRRTVRVDWRQRLIPARAFWIPAVAQGPQGMVKSLKPLST